MLPSPYSCSRRAGNELGSQRSEPLKASKSYEGNCSPDSGKSRDSFPTHFPLGLETEKANPNRQELLVTPYLDISSNAPYLRIFFQDSKHLNGAGWIQHSVRVTHLREVHSPSGSLYVSSCRRPPHPTPTPHFRKLLLSEEPGPWPPPHLLPANGSMLGRRRGGTKGRKTDSQLTVQVP